MFQALYDLPVVIVRPANAYGEGQRFLSGQGFIAAAMYRIKEREVVEVYGARGTVRDYIHVSDVASGIVAALEKGQPGNAYNIGTKQGRSNLEVLRMIEPLAAKANLKVRTQFLPPRKFDVPVNILDSERLHAISGWQPSVALEEGVAKLWDAVNGIRPA
jgi:UDP-glucose 4-epimerase